MNRTSYILKYILILASTVCDATTTFKPNGYCNVPIADLVIAPIRTISKNNLPTVPLYEQLPFDDNDHGKSCRRIGQLILHDPVEIIEYQGEEVCIVTPQWCYATTPHKSMHYWTLRSNITPYSSLTKNFLPANIPLKCESQTIVALIKPWYDKQTRQTYSVGTRFVALNSHKHTHRNKQTVWCANKNKVRKITIPKSYLVIENPEERNNARKIFVHLITNWASNTSTTFAKNSIPYVLGGSSYSHNCSITKPKKHTSLDVASGFDCSHLITRAAQLAGIPLYAANSTMLLKQLRPLAKNEKIENGDIIYFPGHVVVITDVKKGLITEARSSSTNSGYGLVQTLPIEEQFKDIETVEQLVSAYHKQQKIIRINKRGEKIQTISRIIILKLC